MITEKILFRESDGVARLTLNRPDQRNAVDLEMIHAIEESLCELNENKCSLIKVRTKILTSIGAHTGKGFHAD
jgi:enoyl-CoA hydratase/carnithine racemase